MPAQPGASQRFSNGFRPDMGGHLATRSRSRLSPDGSPVSHDRDRAARLAGGYVLGHSDRELDRLNEQARLIDPITRRFLCAAGIVPGMRVLDVGSGAGDLALLAAELVGAGGEVVGTDRSPAALATATRRADARNLRNVVFREGDPAEMTFDRPFDAAIGRYVLMFQRDPAAMLCHWVQETLWLSGADIRMGTRLFATFIAAGLPAPSMQLETLVAGVSNNANPVHLVAGLAGTLADAMERLGVATSAEVGLETLTERMIGEAAASASVILGRFEIGAWSRV